MTATLKPFSKTPEKKKPSRYADPEYGFKSRSTTETPEINVAIIKKEKELSNTQLLLTVF